MARVDRPGRLGIRAPIDGWRRDVGLVLRGEESTYHLSAFGLNTWSDEPQPVAPLRLLSTPRRPRTLRPAL